MNRQGVSVSNVLARHVVVLLLRCHVSTRYLLMATFLEFVMFSPTLASRLLIVQVSISRKDFGAPEKPTDNPAYAVTGSARCAIMEMPGSVIALEHAMRLVLGLPILQQNPGQS